MYLLYSNIEVLSRNHCYRVEAITLDNKFQEHFCICDEYVINLFVCIYEVRKGT